MFQLVLELAEQFVNTNPELNPQQDLIDGEPNLEYGVDVIHDAIHSIIDAPIMPTNNVYDRVNGSLFPEEVKQASFEEEFFMLVALKHKNVDVIKHLINLYQEIRVNFIEFVLKLPKQNFKEIYILFEKEYNRYFNSEIPILVPSKEILKQDFNKIKNHSTYNFLVEYYVYYETYLN